MMTFFRTNSCSVVVPTILPLACLLFFVSACSTPSTYESAFSEQHQIKGNTESISAPMDAAWGCVLEVMATRGWLIQQADTKSHLILAHREMRDKEDKDLSHSITATVTLVSTTDQTTQVIAAANMTTELHKKSYTWWHLLWLIPIFPTGSEYTTVVVNRDTVHNPQLYHDFFTAVQKRCDEKKGLPSPAPAS
jgi:hypothetical protein